MASLCGEQDRPDELEDEVSLRVLLPVWSHQGQDVRET